MASNSGRTCAFCGGAGPFDGEHVLAGWIGEAFQIDEPQKVWHRAETRSGVQWERNYPQKPFRIEVGEVCKACNGSWLSDLESAVSPTLGPMMLSKLSFPIDRANSGRLAFWAAKTLMTLQLALPKDERIVPREHYSELYAAKAAPARTHIAVTRRPYEPEAWPYRIVQAGAEWRTTPPPGPPPEREDYNTYRAVLAVGHTVFHLLGFYDDQREGNLLPGDLPPGFIELWPRTASFTWPPEAESRVADLEGLVNLDTAAVIRPRRPAKPNDR